MLTVGSVEVVAGATFWWLAIGDPIKEQVFGP